VGRTWIALTFQSQQELGQKGGTANACLAQPLSAICWVALVRELLTKHWQQIDLKLA
jgi:hypothetical protein